MVYHPPVSVVVPSLELLTLQSIGDGIVVTILTLLIAHLKMFRFKYNTMSAFTNSSKYVIVFHWFSPYNAHFTVLFSAYRKRVSVRVYMLF